MTLEKLLKTYEMTEEQFRQYVAVDTEFFNNYVAWGVSDTDTMVSSKALDRLLEIKEKCDNGEISVPKELPPFNNPPSKITMHPQSLFMPEPVDEDLEEGVEEAMNVPDPPESITETPERKRKIKINKQKLRKKLAITKAYLAEHGHPDKTSPRALREFLIYDGGMKAEDVALMTDDEVIKVFEREYFVINAVSEVYIIRRSALNSIYKDIFVSEKTE